MDKNNCTSRFMKFVTSQCHKCVSIDLPHKLCKLLIESLICRYEYNGLQIALRAGVWNLTLYCFSREISHRDVSNTATNNSDNYMSLSQIACDLNLSAGSSRGSNEWVMANGGSIFHGCVKDRPISSSGLIANGIWSRKTRAIRPFPGRLT